MWLPKYIHSIARVEMYTQWYLFLSQNSLFGTILVCCKFNSSISLIFLWVWVSLNALISHSSSFQKLDSKFLLSPSLNLPASDLNQTNSFPKWLDWCFFYVDILLIILSCLTHILNTTHFYILYFLLFDLIISIFVVLF